VGEQFLFEIRRVATEADFWRVCGDFLEHEEPMALVPAEPLNKDGPPVPFPL